MTRELSAREEWARDLRRDLADAHREAQFPHVRPKVPLEPKPKPDREEES